MTMNRWNILIKKLFKKKFFLCFFKIFKGDDFA